MSIVVNAIEKVGLTVPSISKINKTVEKVALNEVKPYEDKFEDLNLMSEKPEPGKIVNEAYNETLDVTTWKLANGVTVIVKPTKFQNDLISMSGFRPGGSSIAPDSLYISARNAGTIIGSSGINKISKRDLEKMNMGKTLNVSPSIYFYEELFAGQSSNKDLEELFQMTHLYFTKPNRDENIFDAYKEKLKSKRKNQDKNPEAYFEKKISKVMTKNHLRGTQVTEQQIEEGLNLNHAFDFYKNRFASANEFTFIFVGSFQIDALKEYVTQYLGLSLIHI